MSDPKAMMRKTRRNEEELVYELYTSKILEQPTMVYSDRMVALLNSIHTTYDPKKHHMLPAGDFDFLKKDYSAPTIIKAKKILGIHSIRRDSFWYWSYPRKSPMKAMSDTYNAKIIEASQALRDIKIVRRERAKILIELMKDSHYFSVNEDIYREMEIRGYTRKTTQRTKSNIGIITKKVGAFTMWIYAPREVQDWLERYLSSGAQPVTTILDHALSEKGWNRYVIQAAREAIGSIKFIMSNQVGHWYDAGNSSSLPDATFADNLMTPEQISAINHEAENFIVVDFSSVDEEDIDLPEEYQIKVSY